MAKAIRLPRRKFSDEMKINVINRIDNHRNKGMSLYKACAIENIRFNYYNRWINKLKINSRGSDSVHSNSSVPCINAFNLFLSQAKPGSFFTYIKE